MSMVNSICEYRQWWRASTARTVWTAISELLLSAAQSLMARTTPAQVECQQPSQDSFIYTRTMSPAKSAPSRDPCNYPGEATGVWHAY